MEPVKPPQDDPSCVSIILEPVVACKIPPAERMYVVQAAVSANETLSTMGVYNRGISSSLSPVAKDDWWNTGKRRSPFTIVPVLSLRTVIASIPDRVAIWFLMTDMQGHDFAALANAGDLLDRVHYMKNEVWIGNVQSYAGLRNDFCLDHFPFLVDRGFALKKVAQKHKTWYRDGAHAARDCPATPRARVPGLNESDALWSRPGTTLPRPPHWRA